MKSNRQELLREMSKLSEKPVKSLEAQLSPGSEMILSYNDQFNAWKNEIRLLAKDKIASDSEYNSLFKHSGSVSDERAIWYILSHIHIGISDFNLYLLQKEVIKIVPDIPGRSVLRKLKIAQDIGVLTLDRISGYGDDKRRRYSITSSGYDYIRGHIQLIREFFEHFHADMLSLEASLKSLSEQSPIE